MESEGETSSFLEGTESVVSIFRAVGECFVGDVRKLLEVEPLSEADAAGEVLVLAVTPDESPLTAGASDLLVSSLSVCFWSPVEICPVEGSPVEVCPVEGSPSLFSSTVSSSSFFALPARSDAMDNKRS